MIKDIQNKPIRIIANSLPKSGTHLLIRVLHLLGYKEGQVLMGSIARVDSTRNPFNKLKILSRCRANGLSVDMDDLSLKVDSKWLERVFAKQLGFRYYPAHLPYTCEMEELLVQQNVKIFTIIRDPRDVAISYANYMIKDKKQYLHDFFKKLPDTKTRIKYVLSGYSLGKYTLVPLRDRISRTMGWHSSDFGCSLKFENLVGTQGGGQEMLQRHELAKILNYLDIQIDDLDFEALAGNIFHKKSKTFHSGQVNQWSDILIDDLKDCFKRECGDALISLDYEKDNNW